MKSLNKLFALIAVAGLAMSTLSVQASNSEIILDQSVNDYTDAETYAGREDEGTYGSVHFVAKSILDEAVDDYSSVSTMSMGQDMERTEIAALKPISKERFDVTWELKVMVAIFEHQTGDRISNAMVHASIVGPEGAGLVKPLESMVTTGVISYGNFFVVPDSGPFRIRIVIRRPNVKDAIETEFEIRQAVASVQ